MASCSTSVSHASEEVAFDSELTREFIAAVVKGNMQKAKRLLQDPQTSDLVDVNHQSGIALRHMSLQGRDSIVELLLARTGRNQVTTPPHDCSPLLLAARQGHATTVRLLLAIEGPHAFDVHARHEAAFRAACARGQVVVVREFLALRGDRGIDAGALANDALIEACRGEYIDVVQELLALPKGRGVDVAARDNTALRMVCKQGNVALFRVLVEHSGSSQVDTNALNGAPLRNACRYGHLPLVRELLALEGGLAVDPSAKEFGAFQDACRRNKVHIVRELLSLQGSRAVNVELAGWRSPMAAACGSGSTEVVRELLALGGERRVKCDLREEFITACSGHHLSTARLVLQSGRPVQGAVSGFLARAQRLFAMYVPKVLLQALAKTDESGACEETAVLRMYALRDAFGEVPAELEKGGVQRLPCEGGYDGPVFETCVAFPAPTSCAFEQYVGMLHALVGFAVRCGVSPGLRYAGLAPLLGAWQRDGALMKRDCGNVHRLEGGEMASLLVGSVLSLVRPCIWRGLPVGEGGGVGSHVQHTQAGRLGRRVLMLYRIAAVQQRRSVTGATGS